MATYYWVGGSGNLNDYAGHVSTTSGGAPNAANVQGTAHDLIFDTLSSAGSYSVDTNATAHTFKNLTLGAPATGALTLTGPNTLSIYGNLVIAASTVLTWNGPIQMRSTSSNVTITTNGVSLPNQITINTAAGVEVKLVGALTNTALVGFTLTLGTFTTDNYALTLAQFLSPTDNAGRVLNLGSSTVTLTGNGNYTGMNITSTGGNFTLNAGTSNIQVTAVNGAIFGPGLTFYDVTATQLSSTFVISGVNTFRNLTKAGGSVSTSQLQFCANQTITGTLTHKTTGTSTRCFMNTAVSASSFRPDTVATITANAVDLGDLQDFQNIIAAGASAPWSGTSFGDFAGNSNITFPAARTLYLRDLAGTSRNWVGSTTWSLTSGGAALAADYQPRGHDTVIIDANTVTSGTGTLASPGKLCNIIVTTLANPLIIDFGAGSRGWFRGDITLNPFVMLSTVTASIFFYPRGVVDQTLYQNGATVSNITLQPIQKTGATLRAGSDLNFTGLTSNSGYSCAFNDQGYNMTFGSVVCTSSISNTVTKTGNWTITGSGTCWSLQANTVFSDTAGWIKFTNTSGATKTFAGAGKTYNDVWLSGPFGQYNFTGSNTFRDIKVDNMPKTLAFTAGTTTSLQTLTSPRFVPGAVEPFFLGSQAASQSVNAADSTLNSVVSDISIIQRFALNNWSPTAAQYTINKNGGAPNISYWVEIGTSGRIYLFWSEDGTVLKNESSSVLLGSTPADTYLWIMVTMDVDDGAGNRVTKFYSAPDSASIPTSWTSLGTRTTVGTTSIFNGNGQLRFGGTGNGMVGCYKRGLVYSGIVEADGTGGTLVADLDVSLAPAGTTPRNLLLYTEDLSLGFTKTRCSVSSASEIAGPTVDGRTITLMKIVEDSSTNTHYISSYIVSPPTLPHTFSGWIKAAERGFAYLKLQEGSPYTRNVNVFINLTTGVSNSFQSLGGASGSSIITSLSDGIIRFEITTTLGGSATQVGCELFAATSASVNSYTGDGVSGIYTGGLQLEQAAVASNYQPVGIDWPSWVASTGEIWGRSNLPIYPEFKITSITAATHRLVNIGANDISVDKGNISYSVVT